MNSLFVDSHAQHTHTSILAVTKPKVLCCNTGRRHEDKLNGNITTNNEIIYWNEAHDKNQSFEKKMF